MHRLGTEPLQKRAAKMGMCCVSPQICVGGDKMPVCVAGYCRDRMCPTCMRRRSARVRVRIAGLVGSMNSPRFLTLTARDDGRGLAARLDELTAAVQQLRRTKVWKRHVNGGVMVWEAKRNTASKTWHPHVHLVIDGGFFPHSQLHAEWKRILGRDGTADIKPVHDRAAAARYIGKYLAKDTELATWGEAAIVEFAEGMHRRRLVATFGSSHAVNVDLCDAEPEKPAMPDSVISYSTLRDAMNQGIEPALRAAPLLAKLGAAWSQLFFEFRQPGDGDIETITPSMFEELATWVAQLTSSVDIHDDQAEPPQPTATDMCQEPLFP